MANWNCNGEIMQIKRNRFVKKKFRRKFRYFSYFGRSKKKAKEQRSFFAQLIVATTILMVFAEFFCLAEFFFAKFHKNNFREIWHRFCIVSLNSFSRKNVKFYEKVCEIRTKNFLFLRKCSFAGNPFFSYKL